MKILYKNANLMSEHICADFADIDGKIVRAEIFDEAKFDKIVELDNKIVIKGFCDMHTHLDKALIGRTMTNKSGTLDEAIALMSARKSMMTEEDIYARAKETARMCYMSGTRYLRTHVDVDADIGIRGILALKQLRDELKETMKIQIVAFPQQGIVNKQDNYIALDKALEAGADLVGGIPAVDDNSEEHIKMVFALAQKYDVDVDMHIDETDNPESLTLLQLADATVRANWSGRVTAGHCCSLAANEPEKISNVLKRTLDAGICIVSLPSTNLYLQGREDRYNKRRGIAPITLLRENGIPVAIASDNIQDPFNPFGRGCLLEQALIAAHGCHMGGSVDLSDLFHMCTTIPLSKMGIDPKLCDGDRDRFLVLEARTPQEAIIYKRKFWSSEDIIF